MILKEAVLAVTDRKRHYERADAYYTGDVAEAYTSRSLANMFKNANAGGHLNFCRPVVDAVHNRLELNVIVGTSDSANQVINDTWEFNQLGLDSNEVHRRALVFGDCYVMVWPDEEGNMEISYNTPLTTSIVYDPERPKQKLYAVKMWEVHEPNDDHTRMNLYYADTIYKYKAQGTSVDDGAQWSLIEQLENPFGQVPVFHFRTERPYGRPEHIDAYHAQDYINKQFVTSQIVTEFQGAKQRWALTRPDATNGTEAQDFDDEDTTGENGHALRNGPGNVWFLDNIEKVGEFSTADPNVFWDPIKDTIRSMASLTQTPLHYFEKTGNVPSGEALRVAEAPLIKKVKDRQVSFGQSWREVFKFVLLANGIDEDVQVKWTEVESLDELERLDAALKKSTLGMSFEQIAKELGYDEEVIKEMVAKKAAEKAAGQESKYPNGEEVSNDQTNAMEVEE